MGLTKNISFNTFGVLVQMIVPLAIIPILTNEMGLSDYGKYMAILGLVGLLTVLADLGLDMFVTKEIAGDLLESERLMASFFWIKLTTCFVAIPGFILAWTMLDQTNGLDILIYASMLFIGLNLRPTALFNGLEKYLENMIFEVAGKLFFLITVLLSVKNGMTVSEILRINGYIALLTTGVMLSFLILQKHLKLNATNVYLCIAVVYRSFEFYMSRLLLNIYMKSSVFFCSLLLPAYETGIYSVCIQLYKVGQSFIGAVARVLYTSTAKTKDVNKVNTAAFFTLSLQAGLLVVIIPYGSQIIEFLLNIKDPMVFEISIYFYFSLFFVTIGSYYGYPVMVPFGKERYAHAGIFFGSIVYYLFLFLFWVVGLVNIYSMVVLVLLVDASCAALRFYFYYFKVRSDVVAL